MAKINTKRVTKIALIVTLLIFSWIIFEAIVRGFNVVKAEYGIDPAFFVKVLIGAEIFFDLGIVFILLGSGVFKLRLRHIYKLDFQNVVFDNKLVYTGFTINRIAAFIPPIYLLVAGWGKLPLYIMVLIIIEIISVFLIATLPFEFKKFFSVFKLSRKNKVIYREATEEDIEKIYDLEKRVWGSNAATIENITNRINFFPKGNVIGVNSEKIVGYVCGVIIDEETEKNSKTWYDYTDNGNIKKVYNPKGKTLFGVSLTVDNEERNLGIGGSLLLNIARMAIEHNLERGILGGRIPYYYKKKELSAEDYLQLKDDKGRTFDPELRLYKRMGLKVVKLQEGYFKDPESLDYGVILEWKNPFYMVTSVFPFMSKIFSRLFRI